MVPAMAEPRSTTAGEAATPIVGPMSTARRQLTIVERARAGDREAFEALVASHVDRAFRTALAILGSEADARDATQDAFIKAWRELPKLREPDRFEAWLGRIVVNSCRSALRTRGRRRIREIRVDDAVADTLPGRGRPLDERAGEIDRLNRAFERLSVADRTLLALHYLEHRSLVEMAGVLGIPEGTVKSRLFAARQSFERALEVAR